MKTIVDNVSLNLNSLQEDDFVEFKRGKNNSEIELYINRKFVKTLPTKNKAILTGLDKKWTNIPTLIRNEFIWQGKLLKTDCELCLSYDKQSVEVFNRNSLVGQLDFTLNKSGERSLLTEDGYLSIEELF